MAESGNNRSNDSDKAAAGRKLLNKHQKSKTARNGQHVTRENNNEASHATIANSNEINFTNTEIKLNSICGVAMAPPTQATQLQATPIHQYFSSSDNNSFDFDSVTIDDPELKHNEIYNVHHHNILDSNITLDSRSQAEVGEASKEESISLPHTIGEPMSSAMEHKLAFDSLQSQLQQQVLINSHLLGENAQLQGKVQHARTINAQHSEQIVELKQRADSAETRLLESQRQLNAQYRLAEEWRTKTDEEERAVISVRKERDVALQDASEVLERLTRAQDDGDRARELVTQVRGQLDMANIRIQQLVTTANANSSAANDTLLFLESGETQREKGLLAEKQLTDMQLALEATRTERDVAAQQYQLYNSQLSEQVGAMQTEVVTLRSGMEQLMGRERDLVAHIGDMERLLQQQQNSDGGNAVDRRCTTAESTESNTTSTAAAPDNENGDTSHRRQQLEELRRQQCNNNLAMEDRLRESCAERDEALRELHQLHGVAAELRELKNAQQVDCVAQAKLLEEIRGDKVAVSRAIEQNLLLKAQVAEMEAAYLSVTQDKVAPLTDQLATARHQLHGYERSLRTLQDAVQIKDRELESMRRFETLVEQLKDRLRHYEVVHEHGAGPSRIHVEVQRLRQENERLRMHLLQSQQHNYDLGDVSGGGGGDEEGHDHHHHHHDDDDSSCHHQDHHHHGGGSAVTSVTVDREDELQQEIFRLKQQLDDLRRVNADLHEEEEEEEEKEELLHRQQQQQTQEEGNTNNAAATDDVVDVVITRRLSRAKAAKQLEDKFTRTMSELVALNDEKQRLEHLVLQLQSETETIGEYVALYQRQRSLLAQRTAIRDTQLRNLQARLSDLAVALALEQQQRRSDDHDGGGGTGAQRIGQLLAEVRSMSTASDHLLFLEQERDERHVSDVMMDGVACGGGGCSWCQGKLITV